jgi:hypothetical protein
MDSVTRPAAEAPGPPSRWELIALAGILLPILLVGAQACLGPEETLAFHLYDDAYYYLGVARNLARGAGSTFDGINPTNGYHPLWCWLLVPIFLLTDDPGAGLRLAGILWFTLAALAPAALWWALRPRTGPEGAIIAAAVLGLQPVIACGLRWPNGLETPLYAAMIALFLGAFERTLGSGPAIHRTRLFLALGALLGLVVLARLSAGFLGIAAALLLAAHLWPRYGLRATLLRIGALTAAACLVAGPSLVWNIVRFEHPMPVSGRILSLQAEQEREDYGGAASPGFLKLRAWYAGVSIPLLAARGLVEGIPGGEMAHERGAALTATFAGAFALLLAAAIARRRRAGPVSSDALALLVAFCVLHYCVYALWLWTAEEEQYRLYYYLPEMMLLAAATGGALGPGVKGAWVRPVLRRSLVAACLLLLVVRLVRATTESIATKESEPGPVATSEDRLYAWLPRVLPPDAVLGAENTGRIGYFTSLPVVNLDGLINDQRLVEAIRDGRKELYILESPIRYIVTDSAYLRGFDVSRPDVPPDPRRDMGELLYRLARWHGCTFREIRGAPRGEVVVEIIRPE